MGIMEGRRIVWETFLIRGHAQRASSASPAKTPPRPAPSSASPAQQQQHQQQQYSVSSSPALPPRGARARLRLSLSHDESRSTSVALGHCGATRRASSAPTRRGKMEEIRCCCCAPAGRWRRWWLRGVVRSCVSGGASRLGLVEQQCVIWTSGGGPVGKRLSWWLLCLDLPWVPPFSFPSCSCGFGDARGGREEQGPSW